MGKAKQETGDPQMSPEVEDLADDVDDVEIEDVEMTAEELRESDYAVAKWKPVHDTVIALHLAGYKHASIAAIVGYDPHYVGRLINDPRAQKAISKLRQRMFENQVNNLEQKLTLLGGAAVENLAQTVHADISPGSKAKKHQDRVSFDVLDMIGVGQESGSEDGMKLSKEASSRLAEALDQADQAQENHTIDMEESEDGSFTPSENGESQ